MEKTLEGGRGPPRAVAPLERETKRKRKREREREESKWLPTMHKMNFTESQ
jgi:hypothetical protein